LETKTDPFWIIHSKGRTFFKKRKQFIVNNKKHFRRKSALSSELPQTNNGKAGTNFKKRRK